MRHEIEHRKDKRLTLFGTEVAKIEARACDRPYRNRRYQMLLPLIAEGPAWVSPWIRLYSRWLTIGQWETDDYIMLVVGVSLDIMGIEEERLSD